MKLALTANAQSTSDDHDCATTAQPLPRAARFWNRLAKRYAAKPVPDIDAYARKLDVTRQYLKPDFSVLELGCGTGSTAITHAPHVQWVRACDFSSKMIAIAQQKAVAANVPNVDFVCATASKETSSDAEYNAVLALSVLHLLDDWQGVISAVYSLLPPGGVFVTSTPCLKDAASWLRWIAPVGANIGLLPQLSFFDDAELRAAMVSAGFRIDYGWQPRRKSGLFLVARKG